MKHGSNTTEDPLFVKLKAYLKKTNVSRTGDMEYDSSVWGFLDVVGDKGGPFRLKTPSKDKDIEEMQMVEKYLSMNKVPIDIAGKDDKLVVVRDLDSYIGL